MRNDIPGAIKYCPTDRSTADRLGGHETTEDDVDAETLPRDDTAATTRDRTGRSPRQRDRTHSSDDKPVALPDGGNGIVLEDASAHEVETEIQPVATDLTKFQDKILEILAVKAMYGLAIKRRLESYYQEEVNHGRLYPNLDELVERGLVEKSELDRRTNEYSLTDFGEQVVEFDREWSERRLTGVDVETEEGR